MCVLFYTTDEKIDISLVSRASCKMSSYRSASAVRIACINVSSGHGAAGPCRHLPIGTSTPSRCFRMVRTGHLILSHVVWCGLDTAVSTRFGYHIYTLYLTMSKGPTRPHTHFTCLYGHDMTCSANDSSVWVASGQPGNGHFGCVATGSPGCFSL